jgi:Universal stress protein family
MADSVTRVEEGDAGSKGLKANTRPADALLTLAREWQASMIVLGTSGERPLLGMVLGSTPPDARVGG